VDDLLPEGNTFEAGVVAGVENVGDTDEKEVRTHEVGQRMTYLASIWTKNKRRFVSCTSAQ
jgi:hypothetical protein